jgi:hypothetical protein
MIEQKPLVPHRWDIETDVVVAGFGGAAGFSGTQRLIPFGPSPLMNQAKEKRSYEGFLGSRTKPRIARSAGPDSIIPLGLRAFGGAQGRASDY